MALSNAENILDILVIGDSNVGKTAMVQQFCDSVLDQPSNLGINLKCRTIVSKEKKTKLHIWDITGQGRFQNVAVPYYRKAMGILLIYDITNVASFNNIVKWLENIHKLAASDVRIVLIGNKNDLEDRRVVPRIYGEDLAARYNLSFIETSALENSNIEKIFEDIAEAILNKTQA
uniref:Uncharacterized protein n=1 Tax=Panagrolaimus superbus TaxID=310955 RepID=A0A914YD66_9BILA